MNQYGEFEVDSAMGFDRMRKFIPLRRRADAMVRDPRGNARRWRAAEDRVLKAISMSKESKRLRKVSDY